MDVSIVIPNYNGEKYILDCIASIYDQVPDKGQIILIDNNSTDQSVPLIKDKYPDITLIINNENRGFAAAVNQGIKASNTKYVILFNNDAFAREGFVSALINCMEEDTTFFSASAKMLRHSEPHIIDNAGDELTVLGWAYKGGDGFPSEAFNKQRTIFSACAGAAIYRREVFEEIGYFDEEFFAYLEDVDIGFRANLHGYKNVFCSTAEVEHIGSATSGSRHNEFKVRLSARNSVYLLLKNMYPLLIVINFIFIFTGFVVKSIYFLNKGLLKPYLNGLVEGLQGYRNIKNYENRRLQIKRSFYVELRLIRSTVLFPFLTRRSFIKSKEVEKRK